MRSQGRWRNAAPAAALALASATLALCISAAGAWGADPPTEFWTRCPLGSGAGQCDIPRGIAIDDTAGPNRGHVYVADQENRRIGEFTAWGKFAKTWGWDVVDSGPGDDTIEPEDQFEICVPEEGDVCKRGLGGGGTGQFFGPPNGPPAIAVDGSGDVYVGDKGNFRIQKFNTAGEFLLMFGGNVNKTKVEEGAPEAQRNLCPVTPGDVCQVGSKGTGKGQFGEFPFGPFLAASPTGTIYVGDQNRIQTFDTGGHHLGDFPDPDALIAGNTVQSLVRSGDGGLFVAFAGKANVLKLNTGGHKACTAAVVNPRALASDSAGNLYVVSGAGNPLEPAEILEFDPQCARNEVPAFGQDALTFSTGLATGAACFDEGGLGIYVANTVQSNSFVRAYGPTPDPTSCEPPRVAPEITAQYAISVATKEATLGAQINANYFTGDAGTTLYYLQYGTAQCVEGGWSASCVKAQPAQPGVKLKLGGEPSDKPLPTNGVFLTGLTPDTAYRYRFVVESLDSESEPVVEGQPVIGQGGEIGVEGKAGAFQTLPLSEAPEPCANDGFRTGAGAALPDCRAYEMVSPVDKDGGDIVARVTALHESLARVDQSAATVEAEGAGITYSTYRPFGGAPSAPFTSQYLAHRHPLGSPQQGWSSEPLSPPQGGEVFPETTLAFVNNLYKYFSADLSEGWLETLTEPLLAEGGQPGYANLYRRDLGSGAYQACTTTQPQGSTRDFEPLLQGVSADGELAVFRAPDKLSENANEPEEAGKSTNSQLYACVEDGGGPRPVLLVSVMPDGTASQLQATVGVGSTDFGSDAGRGAILTGGVSAQGTRVFWTGIADVKVSAFGPGALFVRLNPAAEESEAKDGEGHCVPEAGKACTLPLSPGDKAQFWGAASDGSIAVFTVGEDLYEFDVAKAEAGEAAKTLIAQQSPGVLGLSADGSHIYFASKENLDGSGPAVAGQPNVYLYEAGAPPTYAFVGPISARDAASKDFFPSSVHVQAYRHTAQVGPSGDLLFSSDSSVLAEQAGYDNIDQGSGEADIEVYRYGAGGEGLACISCNPSGARPVGRESPKVGTLSFWSAARIPGFETSLYASRLISEDGTRVFFESFEGLTLTDTNGKVDVYEWEAPKTGSCEEEDATFVESSGGCLYLITTGTSSADTEFVDASADGSDVFIRTAQSLASQDPGLFDIYDARIGGGFPPPPTAKEICEGEACQSPPAPPEDPTPSSATFRGQGNLNEKETHPRRCPKGKRKVRKAGKQRCVAKHHKRTHSRNRGAAR